MHLQKEEVKVGSIEGRIKGLFFRRKISPIHYLRKITNISC